MHSSLELISLLTHLSLLIISALAASTGGSRGTLTGSEPPKQNSGSDAAFVSLASAQSHLAAYAASTSSAAVATATPPLPWSQQISTGLSFGTPNASLPDPCGPTTQPPGPANSTSTCHANVSVVDTGNSTAYGVQCFNDGTENQLNATSCSVAQANICGQLCAATTVGTPLRDPRYNEWVWNAPNAESGKCSMGFWLPDPKEGGAPVPSYGRCVGQIFQVMMDACSSQHGWNGASVNLRDMNGTVVGDGHEGREGEGKPVPVRRGYASYVIMAKNE